MALSRKLSIASTPPQIRRISSLFILKGHCASHNRVSLPIQCPTGNVFTQQFLFYFRNYSISMTRITPVSSFNLNLSALAEKIEYNEVFALKSFFSAIFELLGCTVRMGLKLVAVPVIKALSLNNEMDKALLLWKTMNAVGCKSDVSIYNALIAGMFRARDGDDGVNFYDRPLNSYDLGVNLNPLHLMENSKGFLVLYQETSCVCRSRNRDGALQVFGHMQKQMLPDVVTWNSMIRGLCCFERGCKEAMEFYYEMIKDGVEANVMTYNILITGLCMTGRKEKVEAAYHLSNVMVNKGLKADNITYNSLMHGYFLVNSSNRVREVFDFMLKMKCKPNVQVYNTLLRCCLGCLGNEKIMEALRIYDEMIGNKIKPNEVTHRILLSEIFCVGLGRSRVFKDIGPDPPNYIVFLERLCKNNCEIKSLLVTALASHGQPKEALIKYEEMKQAKLDVMPEAIGSLLEFCQSELDLDEMLKLFEEIPVSQDLAYSGYCSSVLAYCVNNNHLSSANDLLKKLKEKLNERTWEDALCQSFEDLTEVESPNLQLCMDWLEVVKNHQIPRELLIECADYIFFAYTKVEDLRYPWLIFKKYKELDILHTLIYSSMCAFFVDGGDYVSAKEMLSKIPIDFYDFEELKNSIEEAEYNSNQDYPIQLNDVQQQPKEWAHEENNAENLVLIS